MSANVMTKEGLRQGAHRRVVDVLRDAEHHEQREDVRELRVVLVDDVVRVGEQALGQLADRVSADEGADEQVREGLRKPLHGGRAVRGDVGRVHLAVDGVARESLGRVDLEAELRARRPG
ncbi:MAG: hypothetical protein AB1689_08450 [Thermodesulfobacteriota bacterium]